MAEAPQPIIPQMPQNANIPGLNQTPVSPVAQTNPLMALQQGGVQGFSLGLAARQQQALEQERQVQIMAAQQQARLAQQTALTNAATMAHQNFEDLSKVDPDHAVDYYNKAIAPLHQEILAQYGIHMDTGQMPDSHKNADAIDKINSYVDMLKDPSKAPLALQGLNRISNEMDIAQQTREKAAAGMKTIGQIQDYNNHVDTLEQNYGNDISTMKSRSGTYGQQDQKVAQAAHLRTMVNQYLDPKTGEYKVPQAQYTELVMGLANLLSASGTADAETREKLESMTSKGKFNQAVQYVTGVPQTGNTQAIIKNLVDSIDRQGMTAQQIRDNELSQVKPSVDLPPERAARTLGKGRGTDFNDYLPGGIHGPKAKTNGQKIGRFVVEPQ